MGIVIDFGRRRRNHALTEALAGFEERLQRPAPPPETFGWIAVERVELDLVVRWLHPRYHAMIGFVPGHPGRVYLDYDNAICGWDNLSLEDLVLGLETGLLPEPELALDWDGAVI